MHYSGIRASPLYGKSLHPTLPTLTLNPTLRQPYKCNLSYCVSVTKSLHLSSPTIVANRKQALETLG